MAPTSTVDYDAIFGPLPTRSAGTSSRVSRSGTRGWRISPRPTM